MVKDVCFSTMEPSAFYNSGFAAIYSMMYTQNTHTINQSIYIYIYTVYIHTHIYIDIHVCNIILIHNTVHQVLTHSLISCWMFLADATSTSWVRHRQQREVQFRGLTHAERYRTADVRRRQLQLILSGFPNLQEIDRMSSHTSGWVMNM